MVRRPTRALPPAATPLPSLRQFAEQVELLRRAQKSYAQQPTPDRGRRCQALGQEVDARLADILRSPDATLRSGLDL